MGRKRYAPDIVTELERLLPPPDESRLPHGYNKAWLLRAAMRYGPNTDEFYAFMHGAEFVRGMWMKERALGREPERT